MWVIGMGKKWRCGWEGGARHNAQPSFSHWSVWHYSDSLHFNRGYGLTSPSSMQQFSSPNISVVLQWGTDGPKGRWPSASFRMCGNLPWHCNTNRRRDWHTVGPHNGQSSSWQPAWHQPEGMLQLVLLAAPRVPVRCASAAHTAMNARRW